MTEVSEDHEEEPCTYCPDHAPPARYWRCPKCDAEWGIDPNDERPRAKRKGYIINALTVAIREAMRDIPSDAAPAHIHRALAVAAYEAMDAEGVVSLKAQPSQDDTQ